MVIRDGPPVAVAVYKPQSPRDRLNPNLPESKIQPCPRDELQTLQQSRNGQVRPCSRAFVSWRQVQWSQRHAGRVGQILQRSRNTARPLLICFCDGDSARGRLGNPQEVGSTSFLWIQTLSAKPCAKSRTASGIHDVLVESPLHYAALSLLAVTVGS